MENSLNNSGFTVNVENLRRCFEIMNIKSQQDKQVLKEVQNYIEECKKDPQLPAILIQFFENNNEDTQIRWLALIEFKNVIKENWHRSSRLNNGFSEDLKKDIRAILLTFLDKYQEKIFRTQINDILRYISLVDFPLSYPDLLQYFLNNLQGLRETLKDEEMLLSDVTLNFVMTLKTVLKDRSRRRTGDHTNIFYNVYFKLLEGFHDFWDYLHSNTQRIVGAVNQGNVVKIERFLKLIRKSDKIYISLLSSGFDELVENENITKIVGLLVQRAVELTENTKNLKGSKDLIDIYEEFNKNLFKYLYSLSQLQTMLPLLFKDVLVNYMNLLEYVLDNSECFTNEYVLKAAAICLTTALRRYSPTSQDTRDSKKPLIEEVRKHCINQFHNYFSSEKIEAFFNIFLLKMLPRRQFLTDQQDPDNLDEFVEIENDQYASEFEKIETPLYNLTLKCALEFFQRFSEHSIPLIHNLTSKVIQNQLSDLPIIIIDGIFAMVGQLPTAYNQIKIDPSNYLDLGIVIKYLEEKAALDLNLSKRIPVLIHKWIGLFNANAKNEIVHNVVQITQSLPNYVVRYECCMCLKVILKSEETFNLNYAVISGTLVPVIIDLLGRFKNPQAVWGLIELMKLLFMRAQYSVQDDNIIAQLQNQNILALTRQDDPLLMPALVDMFKTIIASFPYGTVLTSVFVICIEFIDYHFKENRLRSALLSLWLFIAREYTEIQNIGDGMKTLFGRYSTVFVNMNNPDELSKFVNIIEEYILAELISTDDYLSILKIMEEKYELALKIEDLDESICNLKSAILSLMSTLLLIILKQNSAENLKIFEKMLILMLKDLLSPIPEYDFKSLKASKASLITLINRFLIVNLSGVFQILNEYQIGLGEFIGRWTKDMSYLHSPQTKQINSVAILSFLPHIKDKQLVGAYLEAFANASLANVVAAENGHKIPNEQALSVSVRCEDVRDSERKREIRKSGLYFDVNLKELFSAAFNETIRENNLSLDEIKQCFSDQRVVELMLQICNN